MNITDADYNKIATYVYEIDPVDKPYKQSSVGETIDINDRQFQVIDKFAELVHKSK